MPSYSLKPQLSITPIDKESVLLDVTSGQYYGLDEVGTLIIEGLRSKQSIDQIVTQITAEYAVSQSQAQIDAHTLLRKLLDAGLLITDTTPHSD